MFMFVVERIVESSYENGGFPHDDESGRTPCWCPVLSIFTESIFASFQKIIDALF